MRLRLPDLEDADRRVVDRVVAAIADGEDFDDLRQELGALERRPPQLWLSLPLLVVAAGLVTVVVELGGDGPWEVPEAAWEEYLPECRPHGAIEWRNANYALQAAGCLAAGVWLDVGRQEAYWRLPLWPYALNIVELLAVIVTATGDVDTADLAARLRPLLAPAPRGLVTTAAIR